MENEQDISVLFLSFFSLTKVASKQKEEDFSEAKVSYEIVIEKTPIEVDYQGLSKHLNNRDTFHLKVLKEGAILGAFTNRSEDNFSDYIANLNSSIDSGDTIEVVLTLEKNKKEKTLSIYFLDEFIQYLKSLSFFSFINSIDNQLSNETLTLEIQNETIEKVLLQTKTILIATEKSNSKIEIINEEIRIEKIEKATALCHWDIENKNLLPEDLFPILDIDANSELTKIFQKAGLLYTTMFIFDYLSVKENSFSYKLNGYKTFGEEIKTNKIDEIEIDYTSVNLFYEIYIWIYTGGNINDKISIARNIISLNYIPKNLDLTQTTFDSIRSNYKIYERQNVKQYIEVRNKLSEILIDLQGKIDKIVDGFISDYKKNIITLISFFISVIVIRVVSKGDFIGGFTNEIIFLSYSFFLISIVVLVYSRWEFGKRISMFDKHYEQLKDRYKELLSEDELNKIFEDCNPKNKESKSFVDQQKKYYTILWVFSIVTLAITLTIIYYINNFENYVEFKSLLKFLLCCTKNI